MRTTPTAPDRYDHTLDRRFTVTVISRESDTHLDLPFSTVTQTRIWGAVNPAELLSVIDYVQSNGCFATITIKHAPRPHRDRDRG